MRFHLIVPLIGVLAGATSSTARAQPDREPDRTRPNIVIILADDIGYGDLSCYGATKVKTPNLDKLATQGMRFTDAHCAAAVCTPTRYALLTGQYAWRHDPARTILSGVAPLAIPLDRMTVPKLLKKADYATGVVGKWHLGLGEKEPDYNVEIKPGPKEVGFDYSFIIPATADRTPCVYVENGRVVGYDPKDPIRVSYKEKVGDEPTGRENPDLLFNQKPSQGHDGTIVNGISRIGFMTGGKAARWKDEDMADELTKRAVAFITQHKEKPFFLYFATSDIHVPRFPHSRFRGKSEHGLRGDAIVQLDWCAGEIMLTLDKLKLTDNTLLIFTSDNGGVMDDGYLDGTRDDKRGHKCNGVLRGFKGGPYEGGTRVPLIARWPGRVPVDKTSGALVSSVDFLASFAAITGTALPKDAGPDSFDILPALLAEKPAKPCRETLTMHGNPIAVRQGKWKLVPAVSPPKGKMRPAELYDLEADLSETNNLADKHPDKVKELTELLEELRKSGRSPPVGK
jgi:arylsulfatase A-like enzyme